MRIILHLSFLTYVVGSPYLVLIVSEDLRVRNRY
jgi:hypothetical protein